MCRLESPPTVHQILSIKRSASGLSPNLFTVYLLLELEQKGVGCYWNNRFVGAVCYADDIALLAPSAALRMTCYHPQVNASKTQLVRFSRSDYPSDSHPARFFLTDLELHLSNSAMHLEHSALTLFVWRKMLHAKPAIHFLLVTPGSFSIVFAYLDMVLLQ